MRTRLIATLAVGAALIGAGGATSSRAMPLTRFPTGTFLQKITVADLYRAGLDTNDAHWDRLTFRTDGTWTDIWPTRASRVNPRPTGGTSFAATRFGSSEHPTLFTGIVGA